MLFHVRLTHSPDHCWARDENEHKAHEWLSSMRERGEKFGVAVNGSFVNPSEHTFFMLLEAESYAGLSAFLGPPLLTDHEAKVTPIVTFEEAARAVIDEEVEE